jgi:osmotically-inducible protein OsmY
MAQQYRNPQERENAQRSRWRERYYGDRNEEERSRDWERDWDDQTGRRGFSGYPRGGESESGWSRDSDENRWGQGGESRRYQRGQESGRNEDYGRGQEQGYGRSRYSEGGYEESQYRQRQPSGYGGGMQRAGFRGEQQRGHGEFREQRHSASSEWRPEDYSQERQGYGRQYEEQSFAQPYPAGFQREFGLSQRAAQYRSGREGYSTTASHRGKGPKGYTRSDDRLKELICERLTDDPSIDASEISLEVTSQVVKLTGTVDDRQTKYEVEELIERCGGVKDIDNQLRVRSGSSQSSQQMGSQGGSTESSGGLLASGTSQTTTQATKEGSSSSKRNQEKQ